MVSRLGVGYTGAVGYHRCKWCTAICHRRQSWRVGELQNPHNFCMGGVVGVVGSARVVTIPKSNYFYIIK